MFDTALAWRRSSTSCIVSSLIQHFLRFFFTNPTISLALSLYESSMLVHSSFGVVSSVIAPLSVVSAYIMFYVYRSEVHIFQTAISTFLALVHLFSECRKTLDHLQIPLTLVYLYPELISASISCMHLVRLILYVHWMSCMHSSVMLFSLVSTRLAHSADLIMFHIHEH